jgi:hypothetical protein
MQTLGLASNVYLSMATKYTVPETGRDVVGGPLDHVAGVPCWTGQKRIVAVCGTRNLCCDASSLYCSRPDRHLMLDNRHR